MVDSTNLSNNKFESKLNELRQDLDAFLSVYQFPKFYLSNYFSELRNKIDVSFFNKNSQETDYEIKNELNENWIQMIEKINSYERLCTNCQRTNKFDMQTTKETNQEINLIESKLANFKLDSFDEIKELICELNTRIKRIIFQSKTIVFLESQKYLNSFLFRKLNNKTTTGILLFILDEYIDEAYIDRLIFKRISYEKKLSNERIKLEMLRKILMRPVYLEEVKLEADLVLHLEYSKLQLKGVLRTAFNGFYNLETLTLENNHLSSLSPILFRQTSNLKKLFLANNKLSSLDAKIFSGLFNLEELWLQNNLLDKLEPKVFSDLKRLKLILLDTNKLTHLDKDLFSDLNSLKELSIGFNKISHLEPNIFNNLKQLTQLYLRNNSLNSIEKSMFRELKCLELIDFSCNNLAKLDSSLFNGLTELKFISLSNNRLSQLNGAFNGLAKLEELYLDENQLNELKVKEFEDLNSLKVIHLYSNKIKDSLKISLFLNKLPKIVEVKIDKFDEQIISETKQIISNETSANTNSSSEITKKKSQFCMLV